MALLCFAPLTRTLHTLPWPSHTDNIVSHAEIMATRKMGPLTAAHSSSTPSHNLNLENSVLLMTTQLFLVDHHVIS